MISSHLSNLIAQQSHTKSCLFPHNHGPLNCKQGPNPVLVSLSCHGHTTLVLLNQVTLSLQYNTAKSVSSLSKTINACPCQSVSVDCPHLNIAHIAQYLQKTHCTKRCRSYYQADITQFQSHAHLY